MSRVDAGSSLVIMQREYNNVIDEACKPALETLGRSVSPLFTETQGAEFAESAYLEDMLVQDEGFTTVKTVSTV